MIGWRGLAERFLQRAFAAVSPSRQQWVLAALGELHAVKRGPAGLLWVAGIASMIVRDLAAQLLMPWRRELADRPARLAAATGLAFLIVPAWLAVFGGARAPGASVAAGAALSVSLWINAGGFVRVEPLGRLHYALHARLLPLNFMVAGLTIATAVILT